MLINTSLAFCLKSYISKIRIDKYTNILKMIKVHAIAILFRRYTIIDILE